MQDIEDLQEKIKKYETGLDGAANLGGDIQSPLVSRMHKIEESLDLLKQQAAEKANEAV